MSTVDPETLQAWLEWAAAKLIAMPAGRLRPAGPKVIWPDYEQEKFQVIEFRRQILSRALAPSAAEIPIVDQIVSLPNVCANPDVRKIIHWRAQIHPVTLIHINKWDWIASKLEMKIYTVKTWHKRGLVEVGRKTPREIVCRIEAFLDTRV